MEGQVGDLVEVEDMARFLVESHALKDSHSLADIVADTLDSHPVSNPACRCRP